MTPRTDLLTFAALLAAAIGLFVLFQHRVTGAWFAFGVHPEVFEQLEQGLEDQKRLALLDPAGAAAYRARFEEIDTLRRRLRILEHNRLGISRRFELLLLALFAAVLVLAAATYRLRQARDRQRLGRLRGALEDLCAGRTDLELGERRRDAIGRVAAMIEATSRVMARHRRRLAALENLSAWQEAARRHAHEMRTPLTAAQLEVERLARLGAGGLEGEQAAQLTTLAASLDEELGRLAAFTRRFTSFARLPRPRRVRCDLAELVAEFAAGFAGAWPGLALRFEAPEGPPGRFTVEVDREMLRQVLVNLCDNSFQARDGAGGEVRLRLTAAAAGGAGEDGVALYVADDGPGIPAEIRRRLFEPYATTRKVGEGMGLGLAISKKILLDHGGDLELVETSAHGTTFRLLLPPPEETS